MTAPASTTQLASTQLAPIVTGATIGGGSTITKAVGAGELAVARGKQVSIGGWSRPVKTRK